MTGGGGDTGVTAAARIVYRGDISIELTVGTFLTSFDIDAAGRLTRAVEWHSLAPLTAVDMSKTVRAELRLEAFNVLNHFNWVNPQTNFNSGQFGRITTQAGAPHPAVRDQI